MRLVSDERERGRGGGMWARGTWGRLVSDERERGRGGGMWARGTSGRPYAL